MSYPALLAQLRYNAVQLHDLPTAVCTQADYKMLRALLASTLDTLPRLAAHLLAQSPLRAAQLGQSPLAQAEQSLRLLERQFLALSPGQEAPPALRATLQQTLRTVLAELNATYWPA
jgi:hypothetical protein